MKKLFILLLMCIIGLGAKGQVSSAAFQKWHGDKYSMFIHFGLYSQLEECGTRNRFRMDTVNRFGPLHKYHKQNMKR